MAYGGSTLSKAREQKERKHTALPFMSLAQIREEIRERTQIAMAGRDFSVGEKVRGNYDHLLKWLKMPVEEFGIEMRKHKTYEEFLVHSGAMTWSGNRRQNVAIRMPVDDTGKRIHPTMQEVIMLREEELSRVEFANKKAAEYHEQVAGTDAPKKSTAKPKGGGKTKKKA